MDDAQPFPSSIRLSSAASAELGKAVRSADPGRFQKAWIKASSKRSRRFNKRADSIFSLSSWSAEMFNTDAPTASVTSELTDSDQLKLLRKKKHRKVFVDKLVYSLGKSDNREPIDLLTLCEWLLRSPEDFSADLFVQAIALLSEFKPVEWDIESVDSEMSSTEYIQTVIVHAELSWIVGLLLSPLKQSKQLVRTGKKRLRLLLDESTDTDGMLHASLSSAPDQWIAPFARAATWGRSFEEQLWNREYSDRWNNAVGCIVSMVTPAGFLHRQSSDSSTLSEGSRVILDFSIETTDQSLMSTEAELLTRLAQSHKRASTKRQKTQKPKRSTQLFSNQSDWAAMGLLRSGMHIDADVGSLAWDNSEPAISLVTLGTRLLTGAWHQQIMIDGNQVNLTDDWGCTCWFSDKDVAFVELESSNEEFGLRSVRHMMLSIKDHFAVICESITTDGADTELELHSLLPLARDVASETNSITRELILYSDCLSVRAIPAWLDDDRVINSPGSFHQTESCLALSTAGKGGACMPLVLDWHPERKSLDADWARLTVTESRIPMTGHQAGGYRVRIGQHQLMLYRSLQPGETLRAVLGHHTANETVYGQVKKSGVIAPLVLVDGNTEE